VELLVSGTDDDVDVVGEGVVEVDGPFDDTEVVGCAAAGVVVVVVVVVTGGRRVVGVVGRVVGVVPTGTMTRAGVGSGRTRT
jgi:hypothetical protein